MRASETNAALLELAASRHGVITWPAARAAGISRSALTRRQESGLLVPAGQGIWVLHAAPASWEQCATLACAHHGDGALLSHGAAARVYDLDTFRRAPAEVIRPRWARRRGSPGTSVHESLVLEPGDATTVRGLPVTTPARTLLDLAGRYPARRVEAAWEDAFRKGLCSVDEVAGRFRRFARRGRAGTVLARELLEARGGLYVPTGSRFELDVERLLVDAGIEPPERQLPVELGWTTVFLDMAWRRSWVSLECDGLYTHGTNEQLPWDSSRQNEVQNLGWLMLRCTHRQFHERPESIVAAVRHALRTHRGPA